MNLNNKQLEQLELDYSKSAVVGTASGVAA
jgi:hypothetical protein